MATQADKAGRFSALHRGPGAFIIPNPWDAGSARLLAHCGFEALATTSAGAAFALGLPDGRAGREATLANARLIADATDLPVSADLESGFGDTPAAVAETFTLASDTGIVGGSIEDSTGLPDSPLFDRALAVDRVRAAVEAVAGLPFKFTVTARAENFLVGRPDLGDTIARLQAYQEAGADVLYAPGLATRQDIETVVREVDRPVNVLMGLQGVRLTMAELSEIGVRRVSVGGALARAALGAVLRAAKEMTGAGTFGFTAEALPHREINALFTEEPPSGQ